MMMSSETKATAAAASSKSSKSPSRASSPLKCFVKEASAWSAPVFMLFFGDSPKSALARALAVITQLVVLAVPGKNPRSLQIIVIFASLLNLAGADPKISFFGIGAKLGETSR